MDLYIPLISVLLLISSMAASIVSVILFSRSEGYIHSFAALMIAVALWAFGYGMELSVKTLSSALWWIKLEYVGIALLPAIWLVFILKFSSLLPNIKPKVYAAICLVPTITLICAWTTPLHKLLYQEVSMVEEGGAFLLNIQPGIWYHVHTVYFYLSLVIGIGILYQNRQGGLLYRKQRKVITMAVGLPWLINMFYQSRFRPFDHLDLTPLAFLMTITLIGYGLYRYRLMNLLPLARNKVMQAMQEGVLILDHQLRVSDFNPAAMHMLEVQYSFSHGLQLNGSDPLSLKVKAFKASNENDPGFKPSNQAVEIHVPDSNGLYKWLSFSVSAIIHEGETEGYLVLIRDISKEKDYLDKLNQKSAEMEQLNEYKDQLFSIIAHDLKGPVGRLTGLLGLLGDNALTEEQIRPLFGQLRQESTDTYNMLENLLYWTRSQFKGMQTNPIDIKVTDILNTVVDNERMRLEEKSLKVELALEEDFQIFGDSDMMLIVFRNLLSNAIKFSQPLGSITFMGIVKETMVRISIADDGIGIDGEVLKNLFSTKVKSSRGTRQEKGTGIGLQLCQQLIKLNHGSITLDSEAGKGTTVHVCLPKI